MKICPNCNANNPDDSMFCENCGTSLGAVAPVEAAAPVAAPVAPVEAPAEPEKKGGGAKIAIIIVAVVLVLALAGGAIWFFVLRDDAPASDDSSVSDDEDKDDEDDEDEDESKEINDNDASAEEETTKKNNDVEATKPVDEETTKPADEVTTEKPTEEITTQQTVVTPPDNQNNSAEQKVAAYVELYKEDLIYGFNQGLEAGGLTCSSEVEAVGRGIVITVCINELDNLSAEQIAQMQSSYNSMSYVWEQTLASLQTSLPEAEYLKLNICEKDGDLIAIVVAGNE